MAWDQLLTVVLVVLAITLVGAMAVTTFFLLRRSRAQAQAPLNKIENLVLADVGPPVAGPRLTSRGVPMRLALVVVAPVGRNARLPAAEQFQAWLNLLVPRLGEVAAAHQARVQIWPPQLSHEGFCHSLFATLQSAGKKPRGSPWCALAGKCAAGEETVLLGMALCANTPHSLGQVVVRHEYQWHECVQVTDAPNVPAS